MRMRVTNNFNALPEGYYWDYIEVGSSIAKVRIKRTRKFLWDKTILTGYSWVYSTDIDFNMDTLLKQFSFLDKP